MTEGGVGMTNRDAIPSVTIEGITAERRAQVLALPHWTLLRAGWVPESGRVQGGVFYRVGEGLGPAGRDEYHTDVLSRAVSGAYDLPWGIEVLASPARVAVVRPTRDSLAEVIALRNAEYYGEDEPDDEWNAALNVADAVLALFAVAVSDSQDTRDG